MTADPQIHLKCYHAWVNKEEGKVIALPLPVFPSPLVLRRGKVTVGAPGVGHVSFLSDGKFYRTHLTRLKSPAVEINASLTVVVKAFLDEINIGIGRF